MTIDPLVEGLAVEAEDRGSNFTNGPIFCAQILLVESPSTTLSDYEIFISSRENGKTTHKNLIIFLIGFHTFLYNEFLCSFDSFIHYLIDMYKIIHLISTPISTKSLFKNVEYMHS